MTEMERDLETFLEEAPNQQSEGVDQPRRAKQAPAKHAEKAKQQQQNAGQ